MSLSRRHFLAWATAFGVLPAAGIWPAAGVAAPLAYDLRPAEIAPGTWTIFGAREDFSRQNGGLIVNSSIIATLEGAVLIDTGCSLRHGEALRTLAESLTGTPVVRVYLTHHHPDHMLGNLAFDPAIIAAHPAVIEGIRVDGEAFAGNMYALLGDWMRGTSAVVPGVALTAPSERIGGHEFSFIPLKGHTACDMAVMDQTTGVLFAGDIVFLDRALTTPQANIADWQTSLATLATIKPRLLIPGHGPADAEGRALAQTADYLGWMAGAMGAAVEDGLDMTEAMDLAIPERFSGIVLTRHEWRRSVVHFYPTLEAARLPLLGRRL